MERRNPRQNVDPYRIRNKPNCRFFIQGFCKNGDECLFPHIRPQRYYCDPSWKFSNPQYLHNNSGLTIASIASNPIIPNSVLQETGPNWELNPTPSYFQNETENELGPSQPNTVFTNYLIDFPPLPTQDASPVILPAKSEVRGSVGQKVKNTISSAKTAKLELHMRFQEIKQDLTDEAMAYVRQFDSYLQKYLFRVLPFSNDSPDEEVNFDDSQN